MSLERQIALLFASAACLTVAIPCYMRTENPIQVMLYGVGAAIALGWVGGKVGHILANPRGRLVRDNQPSFFQRLFAPLGKNAMLPERQSSNVNIGEETFLDDI